MKNPLKKFWQQRTAEVTQASSNPIADALALDAEARFNNLKQIQKVNLIMEITMIIVFVAIVAAVCL
jgi:hypothetical protein